MSTQMILPNWISVTKSGRISYYPSAIKGEGTRKFSRGRNYAEALRKATVIVREVETASSLAIDKDSTWADLFATWEANNAGVLKEGTYRRRLSGINAHLLPAIGHVKLVSTDTTTLSQIIDHVVSSGCKEDNYKSVVQTATVVAKWARTRKWVAADCFGIPSDVQILIREGLQRTQEKKNQNDDNEDSLTLADVPTWLDVTDLANAVGDVAGGRASSKKIGDIYAAAIRVAAGTGLRMCELLALTSDRVNLKKGFILIDRQLDRYLPWVVGEAMPTAPTKYGVTRNVRIWKSVEADLKFLIKEAGPTGALVPPLNGSTWWADAWGRLMSEASTRISWSWTPHYLRHHYGSYSTAPVVAGGKGLSYPAVQKSMGHKQLETTMRTYIHDISSPNDGWIA